MKAVIECNENVSIGCSWLRTGSGSELLWTQASTRAPDKSWSFTNWAIISYSRKTLLHRRGQKWGWPWEEWRSLICQLWKKWSDCYILSVVMLCSSLSSCHFTSTCAPLTVRPFFYLQTVTGAICRDMLEALCFPQLGETDNPDTVFQQSCTGHSKWQIPQTHGVGQADRSPGLHVVLTWPH